jgi:hypothetical protein
MSKVCPECSREFEQEEANFCDECGEGLVDNYEVIPPEVEVEGKAAAKKERRKVLVPIALVVIIFCCVIGGYLAYTSSTGPIKENKEMINAYYACNYTEIHNFHKDSADVESFITTLEIINAVDKVILTPDHTIDDVIKKHDDEYIIEVTDSREVYSGNKRIMWGDCKVEYYTKKIDGNWKISKVEYYKNGKRVSGDLLEQLLEAKNVDAETMVIYLYLSYFVDKVEPDNTEIMKTVANIVSPGSYSIKQVCELYDWIFNNIKYLSDPNYLETIRYANETLSLKRGDCDDIAVLSSSFVESIGGQTRIIIAEDHAFTQVHIGDEEVEANQTLREIASCYGFELSNYISFIMLTEDDDGTYWLSFDPIAGRYLSEKIEGLKPIPGLDEYIVYDPITSDCYTLRHL